MEFVFEWRMAAATHNLAVLRRYGGNLRTALAAQPVSTISPGSEFRPVQLLAPLLSRHLLWAAFAGRITDGAEFPLVGITDAERLTDVTATLVRGNGGSTFLIHILLQSVIAWNHSLSTEWNISIKS
jgi:hypothetical protein